MNRKKLSLLLVIILILFVGSVSAYTEIRAPDGTIPSMFSVWFPVSAGGLENVTSMQIDLKWDPQYIVVEDAAINSTIPGLVMVEGPFWSTTVVCNKGGSAVINLNATLLNQTAVLPVLFLNIRPTDIAAPSNNYINVSGFITMGGQQAPPEPPGPQGGGGQPFNITVNGTITTAGGNSSAKMGQLVYPTGTVARGSNAIVPLSIGGITSPMNFTAAFWVLDPSVIGISGITLNQTISGSPTLFANGFFDGYNWNWVAYVTGNPGITQDQLHGYLDVNFTANATGSVSQVEFPAEYSALFRLMPSNGFRVTYPFASMTNGTITITGETPTPPASASQIWFPVGSLGTGAQGIFPFTITNLTAATSVNIWSSFNPDLIVIDNITVNSSIPGLTIGGGTKVINAGHGPHADMGMLEIAINAPSGITVSSPTSLFSIHARTADQAGNMSPFSGSATFNGSTFFDFTHEGFIDSAGGGNPAARGDIIAPTGLVPEGGEFTYHVSITNLTDVNNFSFILLRTAPEVINITQVSLSAGVTGNVTFYPDGGVYIACPAKFNAGTTPVPLLDVTFKANATEGGQTGIIFNTTDPYFPRPTWGRYPGFSVIYPFRHSQPGTITIGSPGPRPVPHFTANTTTGQAPLAVGFNAGASDAIGATSYLWNFGEGAPVDSYPSLTTSHAYTTAGAYTVSLQITNTSGSGTSTRTNYINVTAAPPTTIIAPVGSVTVLQRVTIPVSIANLSGAHGIGFNLTFDPTLLKIHNVTFNASSPDYGMIYYDGVNTTGVLRVAVTSYSTEIAANSTPAPLVDVIFEATNKTGSSSLVFIPHTEWSESPIVDDNPHLFGIEVPGQITVTPAPRADLTPVLIASPLFIKKNADGTLNITASFRVDNLGNAGATAFKIEAEFAGSTANFTQGPATGTVIPAGGNLVYNWVVRVIPGYGDTTLGENRLGNIINKTVTAGGDPAIGLKTINMTVDPYNDIEEINETNNRVSVQTTIARPNLTASLFYTLVSGIPDSNTSIQDTVIPGTYRIAYSVTNTGNVFADPTHLNFSVNGLNTTHILPQLGPGQYWNGTSFDVIINQYSGRYDYAVYENYDHLEKEGNDQPADYADNARTISLTPVSAVSIALPTVTGSTGQDTFVSIRLTGISSSAPVKSVTIPFVYDPTVVSITGSTTIPGVSLTNPTYGRVTLSGPSVTITSDTEIANITLRANDDTGRPSPLTSTRAASVKTDNNKYLELNITSGSFLQQNLTDAGVNVFTSPRGQVFVNKTISLTVFNLKATPVTVNANITVTNTTGTRQIWQQNGIALGPNENRDFSITTWTPSVNDEYQVNATITGDDKTDNNRDSRQVFIDAYTLDITTQNRQWWNYNVTVFPGSWIYTGTYYSASQAGNVQGTVNIWYNNGTPVDLSNGNVFDFWYYTPRSTTTYGYNSNWNYVTWWILPKQIGTYNYSISLDAKGKHTDVNGTFTIAEPYVDIKVINSTVKDAGATGITLPFEVFNETAGINKQVTIKAAAGAEGRTLQGLDYLTYYPYGCPEQTMSPTLATLRILQYYEKRGTLTSEMRTDLNSKILRGVQIMSAPAGSNAQQQAQYRGTYGDGSGGWAWGTSTWNAPSMFYTMYPNYVLNEVLNSNTTQWGPYIQPNAINFSESATWLMNRQRSTGEWVEYGYIYDPYIWTGYTTLSLDHEYDNLNVATKERVNQSMQKSVTYLVNIPDNGVTNDARAFTIMGLVGIKNRIGNTSLNATIDGSIANISAKLMQTQHDTGLTTSWDGGGYWYVNDQYTTAQVLKALNATGAPYTGENATILKGVRHLVGIYNTGGRWSNTATTAGVMEAILQLQPKSIIDGSANIAVLDADGGTIKTMSNVEFNNSVGGVVSHTWDLSNAEVGALNNKTGTAHVVVTGWVKGAGADDVQLLVSVDNRMQLPISVARAKIPPRFIDPIADNFTLSVTVPANMKQGDSGNVSFTVNNNFPTSADQYVMVVEIPVNSEGVTFEGSSLGSNMSYYIGTDLQMHYINHQFNATTSKLTFFPGSDNETLPSVLNQTTKIFFVPLKFSNAGNITVQARAYPMYNDEWMAIGNGTSYLKGFGNITLTASDQNSNAVIADFFVDGSSVATGTNKTTVTNLVERTGASTYAIAIRNGTSWVNASIGVNPGDTTTYAAQFVMDTTVPHISTIVGATDEVTIMSPVILDSVRNSSTNHWNAVTLALKSFNSSIASSGGIANIEIDLPTVARAIGTIYVNDTISIAVHNASGWYSYTDFTVLGTTLRINNVNTGDIDQIMIGFNGRMLGDVTTSRGVVNVLDALRIAQYTVNPPLFTGNDMFYADVTNSGVVNVLDALRIAQYTVGLVDGNYETT